VYNDAVVYAANFKVSNLGGVNSVNAATFGTQVVHSMRDKVASKT
jgi:hypothetical protein